MLDSEAIEHQRNRLTTYRTTLAILLQQRAAHTSAHTPPAIIHSILEARTNIRLIKAALREEGVEVDDYLDDEEPPPQNTQSPKKSFWNRLGFQVGLIASLFGIYIFLSTQTGVFQAMTWINPLPTNIPTPLIPVTPTPIPPKFPGKIIVSINSENIFDYNKTYFVTAKNPTQVQVVNIDLGKEYSFSRDGTKVVYRKGDSLIFSNFNDLKPTIIDGNFTYAHDSNILALIRPFQLSPDGQHVVFRDGNGDLFVIDVKTKKIIQLQMSPNGKSVRFSFSPDSQKIAFTTYFNELMMEHIDGSDMSLVSKRVKAENEPTWSSDSDQLAFVYIEQNNDQVIKTIKLSTSEQNTILTDYYSIYGPIWSPDDDIIAFIAGAKGDIGVEKIYIMNSDGSDVTALSDTGSKEGGGFISPTWYNNGTWLAFAFKTDFNVYDLYIINTESKEQIRVATNITYGFVQWVP